MILHGDCREQLRSLPDNSIDSIVTDPPYGLEFMGKEWDSFKSGRSANYASGGKLHDPADRRGKGGAGPEYVKRPAKRCGRCGKQAWSGSPCECDEPQWLMDNSPLHAYQAWFQEVAIELFRVLKPGGHLLAFGGTRTYHRMTVAIEDAGFEIRDSLHWLYGSGFPKSLDVSKAIDKQRYDRADVYRVTGWVRAMRDAAGITNRDIDDAFGANGMGRHWTDVPPNGKQPAVPTLDQVPTLLDVLGLTLDDVPDDIRTLLWDLNGRKGQPGENWWKREILGSSSNGIAGGTGKHAGNDGAWGFGADYDLTAPATDAAVRWDGWGTALKPAHEPIVLARKPLAGTVAANVVEYGTGALNIDACRVGANGGTRAVGFVKKADGRLERWDEGFRGARNEIETLNVGRWPANIILAHSPECETECVAGCPVSTLNEQSGPVGSWSNSRPASTTSSALVTNLNLGPNRGTNTGHYETRSGGASRFFTTTEWDPELDVPFLYVAKPSRKERNAGLDGTNGHPTVKPVTLIRHLVRLITPPGGTVLDPFLGSGTTAVAAILEGFKWIGCELTDDYVPIIEARVAWANGQAPTSSAAPTEPTLTLFGGDL